MSPQPPLTADELLELWNIYAPSEFVAQLRIDLADDHERRNLDKLAIRIWKGRQA
jgi:hypothetical protein